MNKAYDENTPINHLTFSTNIGARIRNCLANENISTLKQLSEMTIHQLVKIPNFGSRSIHELQILMLDIGLNFDGEARISIVDLPEDDKSLASLDDEKLISLQTQCNNEVHKRKVNLSLRIKLERKRRKVPQWDAEREFGTIASAIHSMERNPQACNLQSLRDLHNHLINLPKNRIKKRKK